MSHFGTEFCGFVAFCVISLSLFATRHVALWNSVLSHFATRVAFCVNLTLDKPSSSAILGWLPRLLMKITISKDIDWQIATFAKAPLELLLCDDLLPTTKLLWIVLANQANFRPIDRTVLDRRIGIHRSTRVRAMSELRDVGLISGTDGHIVLHDPVPILQRLEAEDRRSREIARVEIGIEVDPNPAPEKKAAPRVDYFALATEAWNNYRPNDYAKIRRMSSQVLKAVDLHIKALGLKAHSYQHFFSILKSGIEKSDFWSKENSSKTLQSIVGIGQPQSKKYQNVHSLFNDGLEHGAAEATEEKDRSDRVTLPSRLRSLIDNYDELHYVYSKLEKTNPEELVNLEARIVDAENLFREEGLDPSRFRMKYQLSSWPTDVPEPQMPRQRFWDYDDEQ